MATITNKAGDTITAECGGTGGDNVLGTVEEKVGTSLVPVEGAKVTISNQSQPGEVEETTTNKRGQFDVDVDAACENLIFISAVWKDGGGKIHVVRGRFRCPDCPKERAAREPHIEKRMADLDRLEGRLIELIAEQVDRQALIDALSGQALIRVVEGLNALRHENREVQQKLIDEGILAEIRRLLEKFDLSSQGVPPPERMWDILQEMLALLLKLTLKAFWLQQKTLPEFPVPPKGHEQA